MNGAQHDGWSFSPPRAKIEYFADLSKKAKEELSKKDLSDLSADKLFKLITEAEKKLSSLVPSNQFGGDLVDFDFLQPSFTFNPED